jgi:hypothetical protein
MSPINIFGMKDSAWLCVNGGGNSTIGFDGSTAALA